MWHKVAPRLAREYTVVCPICAATATRRKPKGLSDHSNYSKRAMALDMAQVMAALGHHRFHVVGHDRGGRVGHRLARDHGRRVRSLTVLDISPTLKMYESTNMQFAKAYYHWFFLTQNAPLPEKLLRGHVPWYILGRIGRGKSGLKHFSKKAIAEYVRAFKDPRTIHATCEDYRAAASIDLIHDKQDLRKKLKMPLLALWGKQGVIEALFDCLADWREVAADVRGRALKLRALHSRRKARRVARRAAQISERPLISVLYATLRPGGKTCSMKTLRRIAKKGPKEPLEMLGRPLPNQSASHPRQYPQQPTHGTGPFHGGTELC